MSLYDDINNTLSLQDIVKASALSDLRNNPNGLQNYINSNTTNLYNAVASEHSDTFQKSFTDLQRSTNTAKNVLYYNARNKDLNKVQGMVLDRATSAAADATYDSEIARRQFQINQWTNENKMDTLFFMQLLFIYLTLLVPLYYMKNIGILPSSVFYGVISLLLFAVIMTVVVRAQYTNYTRDTHLWNRRKFATMGGPPNLSVSCPAVEAAITASGQYANNSLTSAQTYLSDIQNRTTNAINALGTPTSR
jgi:hypothetical protein